MVRVFCQADLSLERKYTLCTQESSPLSLLKRQFAQVQRDVNPDIIGEHNAKDVDPRPPGRDAAIKQGPCTRQQLRQSLGINRTLIATTVADHFIAHRPHAHSSLQRRRGSVT